MSENLTDLDLALVQLKVSIVYKTSEFFVSGGYTRLPSYPNPMTGKIYYEYLYICNPNDEQRFIDIIKENMNTQLVVTFEYACDLERQDFERKSANKSNLDI